jgi:hypothetical protein
MKTQTSGLKVKKGRAQPGPGRPLGSKTPATIKKIAIKTLQVIMQDEDAPPEARVIAACKLIEVQQ